MNLSRLMILGLLADRGPMHGHQIRRAGELTNAEVWGGITGGAIYSELRKLGAEGLIRAVREEQVGRRPARTVYEITGEGRLELVIQRDAALDVVFGSADPVSVVLLFAAGGDATELGERLAARRRRIAVQLESMTAERERLTARGVLPPLAAGAFRRGELAGAGDAVTVFSRDPARAAALVPAAAHWLAWSPRGLSAECAGHLAAADAVVYLAGAPLFDGRRHSRDDVAAETRDRSAALGCLVTELKSLGRGPGVFVAASSVGYYGYARGGDAPVDETAPAGADWWGEDSAMIERAALGAAGHGVRTVLLRTGYVLTADSLASQVARFRRHAGGWIGT